MDGTAPAYMDVLAAVLQGCLSTARPSLSELPTFRRK